MLPLSELADLASNQDLKVWILARGAQSVRDIAMRILYPVLLSGAFANEHSLLIGKPVGRLIEHADGAIELVVNHEMRLM